MQFSWGDVVLKYKLYLNLIIQAYIFLLVNGELLFCHAGVRWKSRGGIEPYPKRDGKQENNRRRET
jgi:hypothetical protein